MKSVLLVLFFVLIPTVVFGLEFQDVCGTDSTSYCKNVGKDAYNATGIAIMKKIKLGKIIGVSWRPKGSVIGISIAIPSAGIPEKVRTSPRDAYYYIIDNGDGKPFVRQCREIRAQ